MLTKRKQESKQGKQAESTQRPRKLKKKKSDLKDLEIHPKWIPPRQGEKKELSEKECFPSSSVVIVSREKREIVYENNKSWDDGGRPRQRRSFNLRQFSVRLRTRLITASKLSFFLNWVIHGQTESEGWRRKFMGLRLKFRSHPLRNSFARPKAFSDNDDDDYNVLPLFFPLPQRRPRKKKQRSNMKQQKLMKMR